jgi:hypothetical protein
VPFFLAAARCVAIVALVLAAAAEQDQQDDDPANVATKEAVITAVTHKNTSEILICGSSPLIPWYSAAQNMCLCQLPSFASALALWVPK